MPRGTFKQITFSLLFVVLTGGAVQAQVIKMTAIPARLMAESCQSLVDQKLHNLNYDDDAEKKFDVIICKTYMRGYMDGLLESARPSLSKCFNEHEPALDDGQLAGEFLKAYKLNPADDAAIPLGDAVKNVYCPDKPPSSTSTKP